MKNITFGFSKYFINSIPDSITKMDILKISIDIIGWVSSVLIVAAYLLISSNKVNSNSLLYQYLNLFGSIGLIANTYYYNALPSTSVNVIWVLIAVWSLLKYKKQESAKDL